MSHQELMMLQTQGWREARHVQGGSGRAAKIQVLLSPPLFWRGLSWNQPAEVCTGGRGSSMSSLPGTKRASRSSQLQSHLCMAFQEACVSTPLHVFKHVWSLWHSRDGARCSVGNALACPKPWLGLGCGDRWVAIFTLLLLLF